MFFLFIRNERQEKCCIFNLLFILPERKTQTNKKKATQHHYCLKITYRFFLLNIVYANLTTFLNYIH